MSRVASPNIVYVSYNGADVEQVLPIVRALQVKLHPRGVKLWIDRLDLQLGSAWREGIDSVRRRASVWLVFYGHGPLGKHFEEELWLVERNASLVAIPILLPGTNWSEVPSVLRERQGLQLTSAEDPQLERLAKWLEAAVARAGAERFEGEQPSDGGADELPAMTAPELPPAVAELLTPERMARLLARLALSYPDILPCLQRPESANLHAVLRQLRIDSLERLLELDEELERSSHGYQPSALWLATVQVIHRESLKHVVDSVRAMSLQREPA